MSEWLAFATVVLLVVLILVVRDGIRRILDRILDAEMALRSPMDALVDIEAKKQSFRIGAGRELLRERLRQKVADAEKPA